MQRQGGGGKKLLCDCEEVGTNVPKVNALPKTTSAVVANRSNRPAVTTAVVEAVAKRKQAQATKNYQAQSKKITEMVKDILKERGRKLPSGFHLKVAGYLKPRLRQGEVTRENVASAIEYLNTHPNYKASTKRNKPVKNTTTTTAAIAQSNAPSMSRLLAPVPEESARKNNNSANTSPQNSQEEEEEAELKVVNIAGQEFLWNENSKNIYESVDGALGERIGIWPGGDASIEYQGGGGYPQPDSCPFPYPGPCPFYAKGGGCGCGAGLLPQTGGGCGCSAGSTGPLFQGGYRPSARNLKYLKRWKQGKSIGFTMTASLKAKGLIPRTSKTHKGKKVVSKKYKTRRNH